MTGNKDLIKQRNITIAYAEDERWSREPMVEMLIKNGFDVIGAFDDGNDLPNFLQDGDVSPDLFLTDLRMPSINGHVLTEEILRMRPKSKLVILTSEIEIFYVDEAKKAGAVGFLQKILDHSSIVRALREVHDNGVTEVGKLNRLT